MLVELQVLDLLEHLCVEVPFDLVRTRQAHRGEVKLNFWLGLRCFCRRLRSTLLSQLLDGIDKRHLEHSFTEQPVEFFVAHQTGLLQLGHANLLGDELGGHLSILNDVLFDYEVVYFVKRHISDAMELQVIGLDGLVLVVLLDIAFFYRLPPILDDLDLFTEGWRLVFGFSPLGSWSGGSVGVFSHFGMLGGQS